jgi:glycine oxidase
MHVAIIGGGILGCASAEELAARGASVTLLERAIPGAEASSAAAGILGAQVESHASRALLPTFLEARELHAEWASSLRESTGIDVGYRRSGVLRLAFDEGEVEKARLEVAAQNDAGCPAALLLGKDIQAVEPEASPVAIAAEHYPDDGQVDPRALLRALVARIARAGVASRSGTLVRSLHVDRGTCRGVLLDDGVLEADAVVLAAGSWSSLVGGVPSSVPTVAPVRGQMVLLEERPPRARAIVFGRSGYVVPRGDGRVLCGSTLERVGFKSEVTAGGVSGILSRAIDLCPGLASAEFSGAWASFRPEPQSDRPLVGASPLPGLFLATGHHRNGILLARWSARAVAAAILDRMSASPPS